MALEVLEDLVAPFGANQLGKDNAARGSAEQGGGSMITQQEATAASDLITKVVDNIETVIVGKREAVELVVASLIARGHVLLEDLPGTGKTSLVRALARSVDCGFSRIQFTPDVMPSDVSGFSIFNQKTRDFEFRPVGHGCQNVKSIVDAGLESGAKWFIVEQDLSVGRTPLEAAKMSRDTLFALGL